jgi:hypothetical protein
MSIRSRIFAGAPALVVTLFLVACETQGPSDPLDGSYLLTSINGQSLPYDHEGLGCCTYLSGRFELDAGSYSFFLTARNRNTGEVFTVSETGSFIRAGEGLTFTRQSYEIQPLLHGTGTQAGHSLTVGAGGEGPGSPDQFELIFVQGG